MSCENFLRGRIGSSFVHPELSTGFAINFITISIFIAITFFHSILLNHRAHENIIGIGREARSSGTLVPVVVNVGVRVCIENGVPFIELNKRILTDLSCSWVTNFFGLLLSFLICGFS